MSDPRASRPYYQDEVIDNGRMTEPMNKFIDDLVLSNKNLSDRLDSLEGLYSDDWHEVGSAGEPVFLNSWQNQDPANDSAAFYKVGSIVHVKGLVKSGASGNEVFVLPSSYRPDSSLHIATITNSATDNVRLRVADDGRVIPVGTITDWVSIHVSFSIA